MDIDLMVILISLGGGGYLWYRWYMPFINYPLEKKPPFNWFIMIIQAVPLASIVLIWGMLSVYAASDVRDNLFYLVEYLSLGLIALAAAASVFPYLGVSAVLDFLDRRNLAALPAWAGGLLGSAFCYIGSNIGEGPGFQVVVFCTGLAFLVFFACWWLYALVSEIDYTVTVGRDMAAGIRLGGFLMAVGLIIGRAAAGNWFGYFETVVDMLIYGIPAALALTAAAILIERFARPTVDNPEPNALQFGLAPTIVYLAVAAAYILLGSFPA